jgi:ketosteroid isomerase-like protein
MSDEGLVEVVRGFFDEFASPEPGEFSDDALGALFDPEVDWVPLRQGVLAGNTYSGFDGLRRFRNDFWGAWDELYVEPVEIRLSGDQVVAVFRMRGRMRDVKVDELWSALFTFRNRRIVRVLPFSSPEGATDAAGLSR